MKLNQNHVSHVALGLKEYTDGGSEKCVQMY